MKSKNHASRNWFAIHTRPRSSLPWVKTCMRCRSSTDEPAAANEAEAWDWGFVAWDSLTLIKCLIL